MQFYLRSIRALAGIGGWVRTAVPPECGWSSRQPRALPENPPGRAPGSFRIEPATAPETRTTFAALRRPVQMNKKEIVFLI